MDLQPMCHAISKTARSRIIEILAETRSRRELARLLGITPPAVLKYMRGKTHPSDEVICRALEVAMDAELLRIKEVIIEGISKSLEVTLRWLSDRELLSPQDISRLEKIISSKTLSILGSKSMLTRLA